MFKRTSNNTPGIKEYCNGDRHFIINSHKSKCRWDECTCSKETVPNDLYEATTPSWMKGHVGD